MGVSTHLFFSPLRTIPNGSDASPGARCIVVLTTEACLGRANFISTCCTTDRHQDPDPGEVALSGQRSAGMAASLSDACYICEVGHREISRRTCASKQARFVTEVLQ